MTIAVIGSAPRDLKLKSVAYEGFTWDEFPDQCGGFDSVSMAVSLRFENGDQFSLRWRMWEPFECLTTSERLEGTDQDPFTRRWRIDAQGEFSSAAKQADDRVSPLSRVADVSTRWAHLLDAKVVAQHLAFQETQWGPQPWSCRLDFDNGRSLVVCLGEMTKSGIPTYLPTSLLVTDCRESAMAFRPSAALASAWTDE